MGEEHTSVALEDMTFTSTQPTDQPQQWLQSSVSLQATEDGMLEDPTMDQHEVTPTLSTTSGNKPEEPTGGLVQTASPEMTEVGGTPGEATTAGSSGMERGERKVEKEEEQSGERREGKVRGKWRGLLMYGYQLVA